MSEKPQQKTATGKRPPQKRGLERRRKLLTAAREMLAERPLKDISYQEIAAQAEIPLPSCYQFYANKLELVEALGEYLTPPFYEAVFREVDPDSIGSWHDLIRIYIERTDEYYETRPAERQLFLSGQVPPEVRLASQLRERDIGIKFMENLDQHFVLPDIPNADRVFFIAIEISALIFSLDQIEFGEVSKATAQESMRTMIAYLELYIPPILKRR